MVSHFFKTKSLVLVCLLVFAGCKRDARKFFGLTPSPKAQLSSITPTTGPTTGGTIITFNGTNFDSSIKVKIGEISCTGITIIDATQMTCITPPAFAGSVNVTIISSDGQTSTLTNAFTYLPVNPPPQLSGLSPSAGATVGGTIITITGVGFTAGATVKIGTLDCLTPNVVSSTSITCSSPAQAVGVYSLTVTNDDDQSATLLNAYSYQAAPTIGSVSPAFGPMAGGATITLTGTGFQYGATVAVGGSTCTSPLISSTAITCTTPAGAIGTVDVVVTNTDNQTATSLAAYSYLGVPTLTDVQPVGGPVAGGTTITLTGTGFLTGATVSVGGSPCASVTVLSLTSATCLTPPHFQGLVDVSLTNTLTGTGTKVGGFTYAAAPSVTAISPSAGALAGGTAVTITGTGFVSGATAQIDGTQCTTPVVVSATSLTCVTPAKSAGTYNVTVTNPDTQVGTLVAGYTHQPAPTVISSAPTAGPLAGGTTITLTGTGFVSGATVTVGGAACTTPTVVSATSLTCVTPAATAGAKTIVVTNSDTQSGSQASAYTYQVAPTLTSISPTAGALLGGTTITLTGTGFLADLTVSVGGNPCTSPTRVSATSATCVTASHAAGTVSVTLTNFDNQSATLSNAYIYQAAPTVTAVNPTAGALAGGTLINITGTGILALATAKVRGATCTSPTVVSATEMTCITPMHVAGLADVEVTNYDNQSGILANAYTYQPAPNVTAVSPTAGAFAGGTLLTVTGGDFLAGATVTVDGNECTSPTVNSSSEITCVTPVGTAGAKNVVVTNFDTQSGALLAGFTYQAAPTVTSVSPAGGALAGGTVVTVTGTGFIFGASVTFGGLACTAPDVVSATTLQCTTPAHAAALVDIVVTNFDSQTGTLVGGYTFQPAPTVSSVSPIAGALAGNTALTVTGTGFLSGATVTVGGQNCTSPTVNSATEIVCNTPAKVAGTYDIVVTNYDSQTGTKVGAYTYQAAPTVTVVAPTSGFTAGGTAITITGTGFLAAATATVGGNPCTSPVVVSATSITCTTPAGTAGAADVVVTNFDTQTGTKVGGFTFVPPPAVTSVSPSGGALVGGTVVTLTGTGFLAGATVVLGGNTCTSPTVVNDTTITCTTAAHIAADVDVTVTNTDTQSGTLVNGYSYHVAPSISSISPTAGALGGFTAITITGAEFLNGATVTVGGNPCTSPTVVSATEVTCVTAAHVAGVTDVVLTNPDLQTASLLNSYTYQPAPAPSSMTPIAGALAGGTDVTINGVNFLPGLSVSIGGSTCTVSLSTATQIFCTTGVNTAGVKDVVVTNADNQFGIHTNGYTYQPAPTVAVVNPIAGALAGGTTVVVSGGNFLAGAVVHIDASLCTSVNVLSANSITCVTPAHAAGAVAATVTNFDTQFGSLAAAYTYQAAPTVSSISPAAGALAGGTAITVTGTGFLSGATVAVGGNTCTSPVVVNATTITCVTGSNAAGTYGVTVANFDNQSGTLSNAYTYQPAPDVTLITPDAGALAGGTTITLTGTGFLAGATVTVDGVVCASPTVASATSMTCVTAARPAGAKDVTVTNTDTQTGTLVGGYTYQPAPTLTAVSPIGGPLTGGTTITLTGTGFVTGATATVGGGACTSPNVTSATTMECVTPAHAAGLVDIVLTNADGQVSLALEDEFTYQPGPTLTSVAPVAGALGGGTTITLTGVNFLAGAKVTVGGTTCTSPTVNSATSMTCVTPAKAAGAYNVVVSNVDTQFSTLSNAYTYQAAPTVASISPDNGFMYGAYSVTITGTGFLTGATARIGAVTCSSPTVNSATSITCTAGVSTTSGASNVVVTNADTQTGTLVGGFNYTVDGFTSLDLVAGPIGHGNINGTTTAARMSENLFGIATDGTNLYVADAGYCVIRKVVIATQVSTTLAGTAGNCVSAANIADGTGTAAAFATPYSMVYKSGYLYVGDAYTIRKVDVASGEVTTIAGAANSNGTTNATGTSARFGAAIRGLAIDSTALYIADTSNNLIREMLLSDDSVSTFAGSGTAGSFNGTGVTSEFNSPHGLAVDATDLYVADTSSQLIRKIVLSTGVTTTIAGSGVAGELDGIGTAAKFNNPYSLYVNATDLFVVDYTGGLVRQITLSTANVVTITGQNAQTRNDIGAAAYFEGPMAIAGDATFLWVTDKALASVRRIRLTTLAVTTAFGQINQYGLSNGSGSASLFYDAFAPTLVNSTLYVPDRLNCEIRAVDASTGATTLYAGNSAGACSTVQGTGTGSNAYFWNPEALTADAINIYVADGRTIRTIELESAYVNVLAGQLAASGASDGSAITATFGGDTFGIATDGTNVYVTDYNNHAVRSVVISTGAVSTLAGTLGVSGTTDGTGSGAKFNHPVGMAISSDLTKLYVADADNCAIREIVISSGEVTTLAGSLGACGHVNDTGSAARFNYPTALTSDGTSLYSYDSTTNVIRKTNIASGLVSSFVVGQVSGNVYHADIDGVVASSNVHSPNALYWSPYGLWISNSWNVRRFH